MDKPDWRASLQPAFDAALTFLEGLPERPVRAARTPEELLAELSTPLSPEPTPAPEVIRALAHAADPGITAMPGGRFFGWVIGGALPAALAADWLTSAWDQNTGSSFATPAAAVVEEIALDWIKDLLELPAASSAALVTGAQMANTTCLAAARNRVLRAAGWDVEANGLIGAPRVQVVVGAERHDAVVRSLRLLGLGSRALGVETDERGRMRPDALKRALDALDVPTIVCAQAGNVNTGAIDRMHGIGDAVDALRARLSHDAVWLHIDGAFGLWARATPRLRALVEGAERADSWATDAHKWLNTPYDCGIAIVKDAEAHRRALSLSAAYLPDFAANTVRSPVEYTPELSRRARGFAVYAALRQLGRRGVRELVEGCCQHAQAFASQLAALPHVQVLCPVELNQVLVRFLAPNHAGSRRDSALDDAHTRAVVSRVQREGTCYMSDTTWHELAAMRISVSNWSTDSEDVTRSVESIRRAHLEGV
jgi:glutamate/tyrosine decarboxylase-like PLP-dependent enzyme